MTSKRTTPPTNPAPPRKTRKPSTTAKSLGLSKQDHDAIKPALVKKHLKSLLKPLPTSRPAQAHTARIWLAALQSPLEAVLRIAVTNPRALEQCLAAIRVIADSVREISALLADELSLGAVLGGAAFGVFLPWGGVLTLVLVEGSVNEICGDVWKMLLRAAAGKVDDEVAFRAIKDAVDHDVELSASDDDDDCTHVGDDVGDEGGAAAQPAEPDGAALHVLLAMTDRWAHLESTVKTFRRKGVAKRGAK